MGNLIREQKVTKTRSGKALSAVRRGTRGTRLGGMQGTSTRSRTFAQLVPQFHIVEEDTEFVIHVSMPGLKEDEVDVAVVDNKLTVSGRRTVPCEESGLVYGAHPSAYSSFRRILTLPLQADRSAIHAVLKNGILTLTVPKSTPVSTSAKAKT